MFEIDRLHKEDPYIFGGYGLFSSKNFITKFDPNLKEWYLDNQSKLVEPAYTFPYYKDKDNLYALVNINESFDKTNFKKLKNFYFWRRRKIRKRISHECDGGLFLCSPIYVLIFSFKWYYIRLHGRARPPLFVENRGEALTFFYL